MMATELVEIKHKPDGFYFTFKVDKETVDEEVGYDVSRIFVNSPNARATELLKVLLKKVDIY